MSRLEGHKATIAWSDKIPNTVMERPRVQIWEKTTPAFVTELDQPGPSSAADRRPSTSGSSERRPSTLSTMVLLTNSPDSPRFVALKREFVKLAGCPPFC